MPLQSSFELSFRSINLVPEFLVPWKFQINWKKTETTNWYKIGHVEPEMDKLSPSGRPKVLQYIFYLYLLSSDRRALDPHITTTCSTWTTSFIKSSPSLFVIEYFRIYVHYKSIQPVDTRRTSYAIHNPNTNLYHFRILNTQILNYPKWSQLV